MASIDPTPERLQRFLAELEDGRPVVMINLLRYRPEAAYAQGADAAPCSGREAYQRYAEHALAFVARVGARPLWTGAVGASLIAPDGEEWDDALLVEYPDRAAFLTMVSDPDYRAITFHRTAALADSRLICTYPTSADAGAIVR